MRAQLLKEAEHLPVEERIELAGAIWNTVAEDLNAQELPVSAAHREVLDQRLADLEERPEAGRSWDEVRAELEKR